MGAYDPLTHPAAPYGLASSDVSRIEIRLQTLREAQTAAERDYQAQLAKHGERMSALAGERVGLEKAVTAARAQLADVQKAVQRGQEDCRQAFATRSELARDTNRLEEQAERLKTLLAQEVTFRERHEMARGDLEKVTGRLELAQQAHGEAVDALQQAQEAAQEAQDALQADRDALEALAARLKAQQGFLADEAAHVTAEAEQLKGREAAVVAGEAELRAWQRDRLELEAVIREATVKTGEALRDATVNAELAAKKLADIERAQAELTGLTAQARDRGLRLDAQERELDRGEHEVAVATQSVREREEGVLARDKTLGEREVALRQVSLGLLQAQRKLKAEVALAGLTETVAVPELPS